MVATMAASSGEDVPACTTSLVLLPMELLSEIIARGTPRDHSRCVCVCSCMQRAVIAHRHALVVANGQMLGLGVDTADAQMPLGLALRGLVNLRELHLRHTLSSKQAHTVFWASGLQAGPTPLLTDEALKACPPLAKLELLDLRGQMRLSGKGVEQLAAQLPSLRAIDLTYCRLVGYDSVVRMRNECAQLALVRRLPVSLVGSMVLPVRGGEVETARYWADGSFEIGPRGGTLATLGWVSQLQFHPRDATYETRLCFCEESIGADNGRLGVRWKSVGGANEDAWYSMSAQAAREQDVRRDREDAIDESRILRRILQPAATPTGGEGGGEGGRELLLVQSTRFPEPPAFFPQYWPALDQRVRGSRIGPPLHGMSISRLSLQSPPTDGQLPPPPIASRLRAHFANNPDVSRECDRRALASIEQTARGAESLADVMHALSPALGIAVDAAAQQAWDEELSSSESEVEGED